MKSLRSRQNSSTGTRFIDRVGDRLLRGGRMTKVDGKAASCAPMMGAATIKLCVKDFGLPTAKVFLLSSLMAGTAALPVFAQATIDSGATETVDGTAPFTGTQGSLWAVGGY